MKRNHKIAVVAVFALSVIAVGGAIGATQLTPRQEGQAVLNDAAEELGVEPSELSNALKQGLKNRVDEAVEDGRLTKQQGQRLKERIDANELPFFGLGPGLHRHHRGGPFHAKLDAAAEYLGLTQAQLRERLEEGKTLAQVARDRDKSVDGLIDALVEDAEQKLQEHSEARGLTEAEKRDLLQGLRTRITRMVNGRFPRHPGPGFHGGEVRPAFRPGVF